MRSLVFVTITSAFVTSSFILAGLGVAAGETGKLGDTKIVVEFHAGTGSLLKSTIRHRAKNAWEFVGWVSAAPPTAKAFGMVGCAALTHPTTGRFLALCRVVVQERPRTDADDRPGAGSIAP